MATDKPKGSNKMPPSTAEGHVMSRQVLLRMLSTLALLGRLRPEAHASSLLSGGLTPMLIAGASHAGSSLAIPGPEHHTGAARLDYAYPGLASWAHNTSGLSPLQISLNRPCWCNRYASAWQAQVAGHCEHHVPPTAVPEHPVGSGSA